MKHYQRMVAAALLGTAFSASSAQAQSSSLFGGRGVQASSGTMSNGVGGGNSATGNSGSLTGFTGTGVDSAAGFASGAAVNGGLAGQGRGTFAGNRNSANAATQNGQLNQNGQGGAAARGGVGTAIGGRGGQSGLGSMNRNSNSQRNRGNTIQGNSSAQSTSIRPMQRIAFDYTPRNAGAIESKLGSQISVLASQGKLLPGVSVESGEQGTVTLRGQVGSESERRKAEIHARLEPGVRTVINELSVAPPQP